MDLGYLRLRLEQTEAALALLRPMARTDPGCGRGRMLLAMGLYQTDDLVGALRQARTGERLDPVRYRPPKTVAERLGVWVFSTRLEQLEAGGLEPGTAYELGRYRAMFGDYPRALHAYRYALRRDPEHAEVLTAIGVALRVLGRPADAAQMHRRALAASPEYALAYNNLAGALADLGELDAAEAAAEKALGLDSSLGQAALNVGIGHLEAGCCTAAVGLLADAAARDPDLAPTARAHAAAAHLLDGDATRAVEELAAAQDHELAHRAPELALVAATGLERTGHGDAEEEALDSFWDLLV